MPRYLRPRGQAYALLPPVGNGVHPMELSALESRHWGVARKPAFGRIPVIAAAVDGLVSLPVLTLNRLVLID